MQHHRFFRILPPLLSNYFAVSYAMNKNSGPQRDKCSKSCQKAANLRLFPLVSTCTITGQFKKPQTLEFQMEHQCLKSNTSVQSQKLLPIFVH